MIKKFQMDSAEREFLRNLLHAQKHEHVQGLREGGFSDTGIPKICEELILIGSILEKLKFEVLT